MSNPGRMAPGEQGISSPGTASPPPSAWLCPRKRAEPRPERPLLAEEEESKQAGCERRAGERPRCLPSSVAQEQRRLAKPGPGIGSFALESAEA